MAAEREKSIKIVVVGDGAVGKTSLLITYTSGSFPHEYVPTVFDNYSCSVLLNDQKVNVGLWDTAGQEDYERLRPLSYPNTDVFLVCFSVGGPSSFRNVKSHWTTEIFHHVPNAPFVLVGTKSDLREESGESISVEDARKLASELEALRFMECSAMRNSGVKEVFDFAIRQAVFKKPPRRDARKKGNCSVL
eukprot:CAMPEP_0206193372 /NCGR_PEP_ID=MMETSP0166-20121206/6523_1 /ASSEMBLY_ACC=CAM_ASM_000260 /TAXON_ID=95228 /ORGANISM="Vannella robusta, Strain DIVA3 518/3/11/1/6" /LENGTH=190 /DNA_ID=CAMNT_0053610063 /DNA_START=13 /DNA_END=585 /DNA_ORIENTATION=-